MSIRILAGTALAAGALALPAAAGARPAEQFDSGNPLAPTPGAQVVADPEPVVIEHTRHTGADTLLVLGLTGGALLIGAAGGFGGGRVVTRRHPVRP